MVLNLLKKVISFAGTFAIVLSLSCCGADNEIPPKETTVYETTTEGTPEETTSQTLSEEELDALVQNMPEIVFVISYEDMSNENETDDVLVAGFYVTNTGEIKLYDLRPFESYMNSTIPDIYDKLEEAACDTLYKISGDTDSKKIVSEDELTDLSYDELVGYYKRLLLIEGDAECIHSGVILHGGWGAYRFYGIKNNNKGETECIILYGEMGIGDEYVHSNSDATYMSVEFQYLIPRLHGRFY